MRIMIGDMFQSKACTLVNTINCVGVMGKGIALEFKKRYPEMFNEYEMLCSLGKVRPGHPYHYKDLTGTSIINFPTKDSWRSPSKLSYIVDGLKWFVTNYQDLGITSIAFPPLGCGNGGLSWEIVGPLMAKMLYQLPIEIEVYAPYGTPVEQLNLDYLLSRSISPDFEVFGKQRNTINKYWILILETVHRINSGAYTLHVGRVIFQKICYVLTRSGIPTGFTFSKGSYGPYCAEIKDVINALSNANLMLETQAIGRKMVETRISSSFKFDPTQYTDEELQIMDSTVDLFSRVKDTAQAETIATILYSFDQLKKTLPIVSDSDIYNYVLDWKNRWKQEKTDIVKHTVFDLAMLGWITPTITMIPDDLF